MTRQTSPVSAHSLMLACGFLSFAALNDGAAQAQSGGSDDTASSLTSGDIIVTATKRGAASIQKVPISIQALGAGDLATRGASDFNDFARLVPGLSSQDTGPGDKRYILRGITSSGPGTVGVYLDEVIITGENIQDGGGQQSDIKLFDVDRVEVLKGPQGTTFGSSSLGGTIRYITSKPDLSEYSGYVTSGIRSTKGADLGFEAEGAVNLALVPDRFAVRVAGYYGNLPGYIDSRFGSGIDGEETKAARISAKWAITDNLTLTGMAMYQRTQQDGKNFFNLVDYFGTPVPRQYYQAQIARAPFEDKNQIYNATLEYKADFGTFTATASRFVRDLNFVRDATPFADRLFRRPYYTTGRSAIKQPKHRRVDSYEVRYASDFEGPLQFLAGAFGSDEDLGFRSQWLSVNDAGYIEASLGPVLLDRKVDSSIRQRALFGEIYYNLIPAVKLTIGGRYYDFKLQQLTSVIISTGGAAGPGAGLLSKSHVNGFIPRFNIAYSPTDDINTYVQVAKGFRAGGNNDQTAAAIVNVSIPAGYDPDSLWNYEAGIKTSWLDGALSVNAAAYYIDWKNIQVALLATRPNSTAGYPYTGNGGGAHVKGFEATFAARPVTGLSLSGSANFASAKLSQTNAPPATGRKGDRLPYSPRWTWSGAADYDYPIDSLGVTATVGGDITYVGNRATNFNRTISSYRALPANTLVSARLGVKTDDWSVTLIGTNIFNDDHVINYTSLGFGIAPDELYINRPRTIMLRLNTKL